MQYTDDQDNETVYTFYSQQGEDIFVFRNFLNCPVTDGIFVEVGAFDGVQGSNTKFFEDVLGYTGVLIEPISECIQPLIHNRKHSKIYNYAIHPTDSGVTFVGNSPTAGILCEMSEHHKQQYYKENMHISDVPATTLSSILTHAEISYIDFLSIDVEGAELLVLTSIDWASTEIYVICIELDGTNPEKDKACRTLLTEKGFTFQPYILEITIYG